MNNITISTIIKIMGKNINHENILSHLSNVCYIAIFIPSVIQSFANSMYATTSYDKTQYMMRHLLLNLDTISHQFLDNDISYKSISDEVSIKPLSTG